MGNKTVRSKSMTDLIFSAQDIIHCLDPPPSQSTSDQIVLSSPVVLIIPYARYSVNSGLPTKEAKTPVISPTKNINLTRTLPVEGGLVYEEMQVKQC
ncbi:hypothetical protein VTJ04DRAFT_5561 [Mycothermus thermophilus]|uniref:uncharacterized protein n=1 Tax=Humicola insolens TaxID=85995 RepID=UPI003742D310